MGSWIWIKFVTLRERQQKKLSKLDYFVRTIVEIKVREGTRFHGPMKRLSQTSSPFFQSHPISELGLSRLFYTAFLVLLKGPHSSLTSPAFYPISDSIPFATSKVAQMTSLSFYLFIYLFGELLPYLYHSFPLATRLLQSTLLFKEEYGIWTQQKVVTISLHF